MINITVGIKDELVELKWICFYQLISIIFTIIIIWIHKEIWFLGLLKTTGFKGDIIVTNIFENLKTYIKMSFYWGVLISLSTTGLNLLLLFIKPGLYQYQWQNFKNLRKKLLYLWIIYFISCNFLNKFLAGSYTLWGKMSEYNENIIEIWTVVLFIWLIYNLLNLKIFNNSYTTHRKFIWFFIYIFISLITPPDLLITFLILTPLIILLEFKCFINFK